MSFLDTLRQGTDSTATRVLIGIVGAAFIVSIGGKNRHAKSEIYAVVDGQSITKSEFDQTARQEARQEARRTGRNVSDADMKKLDAGVLEQLIVQEVLLAQASNLHISVSAEEIARILKANPNFQKNGKFDQATYEGKLREQGQSADRYEDIIRRALLTDKIRDFASQGVTVSDTEVHETWRLHATEFDLQYVRIPKTAFLSQVAVTDSDITSFIASNADAIKKQYDAEYEHDFNVPKKYTLSELVLRTDLPGADKDATKKKADEVAALAAAPGADFAQLARVWSEDITASSGGNLGQRTAAQLDPVLATAADAAGVGHVSGAVQTGRGWEIVSVAAIDDAHVIPLADAQKTIADSMIRDSHVGDVQRAYTTKIIDAWSATHAVPRDLTEPMQLAVEQTGAFALDSETIPGLGEQPGLRKSLETAKLGDVLPLPLESKGTLFVVALTTRTDPDEKDFDAEKAGVRAGLLAARQQDYLERWQNALVADATVERDVNFKDDAAKGDE